MKYWELQNVIGQRCSERLRDVDRFDLPILAHRATYGRHFARSDFLILNRESRLVRHAPFPDPGNPDLDLNHLFELGRFREIAFCRNARPSNLAAIDDRRDARARGSVQRMFRLLHHLKVAGKMKDASSIGLAELDLAGRTERKGHRGGTLSRPQRKKPT